MTPIGGVYQQLNHALFFCENDKIWIYFSGWYELLLLMQYPTLVIPQEN
ncbi:hypothetical protein [Mucilaginibacter mallensis]|nr:hypothetical protein [Mucilaginibacter mallensis]